MAKTEMKILEPPRLAIVYVGAEVLADLLRGKLIVLQHPDLPPGFKIERLGYDWNADAISVLVSHPAFDPVPFGAIAPTIAAIEVTTPEMIWGVATGQPKQPGPPCETLLDEPDLTIGLATGDSTPCADGTHQAEVEINPIGACDCDYVPVENIEVRVDPIGPPVFDFRNCPLSWPAQDRAECEPPSESWRDRPPLL